MQLNLFQTRVSCQHCQCETDTPLTQKKWVGKKRKTFHFCGEHCASLWYLEHLRVGGV